MPSFLIHINDVGKSDTFLRLHGKYCHLATLFKYHGSSIPESTPSYINHQITKFDVQYEYFLFHIGSSHNIIHLALLKSPYPFKLAIFLGLKSYVDILSRISLLVNLQS